MYHNFDTVREFHVEISSRCNAACPMCARNVLGGATKPDLELADWPKESIPLKTYVMFYFVAHTVTQQLLHKV